MVAVSSEVKLGRLSTVKTWSFSVHSLRVLITSLLLLNRALLAWTRAGGWRECCAPGSQLRKCWIRHRGWSNPWQGISHKPFFRFNSFQSVEHSTGEPFYPFIGANASRVSSEMEMCESLHVLLTYITLWLVDRKYRQRSRTWNQVHALVKPALKRVNMVARKSRLQRRMHLLTSTRHRKDRMPSSTKLFQKQHHNQGTWQHYLQQNPQHW